MSRKPRYEMMIGNRVTRMLLLVSLFLPGLAVGQEVTWSYRSEPVGWIGITFDYATRLQGEEEQTVVVISEVATNSPAEASGIRVGDTLTHLDGQAISQRVFSQLQETLDPGDLVRITVQRDGRSREVLVEAAARPSSTYILGPDFREAALRLDTLRGAMLRELDSIRVSIVGLHGDSTGTVGIQLLRPSLHDPQETLEIAYRIQASTWDTLTHEPFFFEPLVEVGVPFVSYVMGSPTTDSLRGNLSRIRRALTHIRREEVSLRSDLQGSTSGNLEEALERNPRFRELRTREEGLLEEQTGLLDRLRRVSEEEMNRQWAEVQAQKHEAMAETQRAQARLREQATRQGDESGRARQRQFEESLRERFRSPVILGQSFILGAELKALNPQLAEYFGVGEGVLVTDVVQGTLASEAGLQGGDVIVRLAGDPVASLSDLRFVVSALEGPIRIQVIRKREPLEIIIRR